METKGLENVNHLLIVVGAVDSRGHSSSDGLHGVVRILMLSGGDIIKICRLIADLVLRPGVSMLSLSVGLNPREGILDRISSLGTRKLGGLGSSEESSTISSSSGATSGSSRGIVGVLER